MAPLFKLTNIWGSNWAGFWSAVAKASPLDDFQELKEYFDDLGENTENLKKSISGVVTLFKNSSSFRAIFDGYEETEKVAIVSSISVVPEASQNFEKICNAVKKAYLQLSNDDINPEYEKLKVEAEKANNDIYRFGSKYSSMTINKSPMLKRQFSILSKARNLADKRLEVYQHRTKDVLAIVKSLNIRPATSYTTAIKGFNQWTAGYIIGNNYVELISEANRKYNELVAAIKAAGIPIRKLDEPGKMIAGGTRSTIWLDKTHN